MATLSSFEDLKCWRSCRRFRIFVSGLVKRFPKEENFLLVAQLKDSSRSTTHNIAEGFGRDNALDNSRFCKIARGSLCEAMDQLITSNDECLISNEELIEARRLYIDALAWLDGYIKYLTEARHSNQLREPMEHYQVEREAFQPSTATTANPQPIQR